MKKERKNLLFLLIYIKTNKWTSISTHTPVETTAPVCIHEFSSCSPVLLFSLLFREFISLGRVASHLIHNFHWDWAARHKQAHTNQPKILIKINCENIDILCGRRHIYNSIYSFSERRMTTFVFRRPWSSFLAFATCVRCCVLHAIVCRRDHRSERTAAPLKDNTFCNLVVGFCVLDRS